MAVDAIIFDFDGVIIDTETPDFEVWREFYGSHGLDLSVNLWLDRVGCSPNEGFNPISYFEQLTGKQLDEAFQRDHYTRYVERCAQQPLLSGVIDTLEQAKAQGIKLGIASNSYADWVYRFLDQHDLRKHFDCIRTRGDVHNGKPAPDLYLNAAACLGVPVERCLAIEDSPIGMTAALAARMRCVAVPNVLTAQLSRPDVTMTLSSLADLKLDELQVAF